MARILTIVATIAALIIIILMLRSGRLREKYALLWFALGIVTLVMAVFPPLLHLIAIAVGVQVPANLIFAVSIVLLGGVAIHLSWELSILEGETRVLSEQIAILSAESYESRMPDEGVPEEPDDSSADG